jgi:acyl-CoA dehydrogenase
VTFLGLFSILMGSNAELKREAVASLEAGNLLAFGVSEKQHGSDLWSNEFIITDAEEGSLIANGAKYYIGNTDAASIVSVLARRAGSLKGARSSSSVHRAPFVFFALRPKQSPGFRSLGKIRTLGVRAANVGSFEVKDHRFTRSDVIAEGRNAWDAVFGTVTLGKFFLGFGSIGMCEHAFEEAAAHLSGRVLYGGRVIDMPHIRSNLAEAFARLTAMKLFAYRALDYVHAASAEDRRYLLFCAVQKARVSTEGVKVMTLLQECVGAKGFESDTYFEMALRDAPLIPSLEGSMHINLGLAVQFLSRYFNRPDSTMGQPPSLVLGETASRENPYLMAARTGATHAIGFRSFREAYDALGALPAVAAFVRQVELFKTFIDRAGESKADLSSMQLQMALGKCFCVIAYGQLVAENATRLKLPDEMTAVIFSLLVGDLSALSLQFAVIPDLSESLREQLAGLVLTTSASAAEWDFVCRRFLDER